MRTCVPTSTETPTERGSLTRRDGQGVNRGNGSCSGASPGGRPGSALPRVRGPLDQADRRSARTLAGDDQGVLLRPDRREGAGGQGPLRRACAAAAARTPSRATARATPTRTARPATRARSSGAGPASGCSTRCARGASSTGGCRRRMTGRAHTLAGAAARRSSAWPTMSGPQRRSSLTCSAAGRRRAPLHRDATEVASVPSAVVPVVARRRSIADRRRAAPRAEIQTATGAVK